MIIKQMLNYTSYANQKFDLLNKHQVFIRNEEIEEAVESPDKTGRRGQYYSARKDGIKVIYQKQAGNIKVVTFFPVK